MKRVTGLGITAVGTKVYAAPSNVPSMLVLNTDTDAVYDVSTEGVHSGSSKWSGITAVGHKVYAAQGEATFGLMRDAADGRFAVERYAPGRTKRGSKKGARVAYERSLWQAHFDEAWVKLELTDDHRGQLFDVTVPAHLNCARCLLKSSNTSEAKAHVDAALSALDDVPTTEQRTAWRAKGLLLRATCLREAGRYADAAAALDEASELTDDAAVARARHALRQARRDARSGERAMMRGKIAPPPPPEKRTCAVS